MSMEYEWVDGYDNAIYTDDMIFRVDKNTKKLERLVNQPLISGEENSQFIRFEMPRYYDGVDLSTKNIQIIYQTEGGFSDINAAKCVERNDTTIRFGWLVPGPACYDVGTLAFGIEFVGTDYVLKTRVMNVEVSDGLNGSEVIPEPTEKNWYIELQSRTDAALNGAEAALANTAAILGAIGSPTTAATAAAMVDETKIYVYTGSETGYVYGDWYYYDSTEEEWVDGGAYNATAVVTDPTGTQAGVPADAKAVTDKIKGLPNNLESDAEDVDLDIVDENGNVLLRLKDGHIYTKEFSSDDIEIDNEDASIKDSDATGVDLDISDENGNIIARFKEGGVSTKNFNSGEVVTTLASLNNTVKKITDGYEDLSKKITYDSSKTNTIEITDTFTKGEEIWFHLDDDQYFWGYGQYASYYEDNTIIANNRRGTNGYFRHVINSNCNSVKITIASGAYTNGTELTLHVYRITGEIKPKVVTVKADGTGMYQTIKAAIDSITDANHLVNPYVIEVYPGTYNTLDGYTDEEIEAAGDVEHYTNTSMVGVKLTDGMSIKGIGKRDDIILTCSLDPDDWSSDVRYEISTLNIQGEGSIENMTIIGEYIRYCVHDDFRTPVNSLDKRVLRNLIFKGKQLSYYPFFTAYGAGMSQPRDYLIENCDFGFDLGIHSNSGYTYGCTIEVNNCSGCRFRIGDSANASGDAVNRVIVNNCNFQVLRIAHNDPLIPSHMIILGTGNENTMIKDDTETVYRLGMIDLFPTGLTTGTLVKRASSGLGVEATSDAATAHGIVIGSDNDFSYVQTKGYIASNYLGLTGLSVGDYVTVDSSTHSIVTGGTSANAVGVVKAVDSDGIAYIKIL